MSGTNGKVTVTHADTAMPFAVAGSGAGSGGGGGSGGVEWRKWSIILTLLLALLAVSVQWGMVNARLDQMDKRLDELIFETRGLRDEYRDIDRRLSFLEGQKSGGNPKP
ncbi:MAG: hypothetical protein GC159_17395 [Phycisphaera sp.]|nr:hypothetical protein [Phycisphaera sp.]